MPGIDDSVGASDVAVAPAAVADDGSADPSLSAVLDYSVMWVNLGVHYRGLLGVERTAPVAFLARSGKFVAVMGFLVRRVVTQRLRKVASNFSLGCEGAFPNSRRIELTVNLGYWIYSKVLFLYIKIVYIKLVAIS